MQEALTGQPPQLGAFGVQIVAPSSMSAWLKHPGRSSSQMDCESFQWSRTLAGVLGSPPRALSLDRTWITLPSTTPARLLYAIDAIADAVYIPAGNPKAKPT